MIIREKPSAWQLLFVMRGSIIPAIAPRLAFVTALSGLIVALQDAGVLHLHDAGLPFPLIGIALSIFAGFRNSACYDRWWEGRKVFGQLLIDTRALARLVLAHLGPRDPVRARRVTLLSPAFAYLLRDHMRGLRPGPEALGLLEPAEAARARAARNPPNLLLLAISREIAAAAAAGLLSDEAVQTLELQVGALGGVLAAAERIQSTPVPYTYSLMLHRTAYLFCLLLPFGLVAAAGAWTPLVVLVVSYTFFGLDALGDELESPFDEGQNALPLSAMVRSMEIDVREMLGDAPLPEPLQPVDYILS